MVLESLDGRVQGQLLEAPDGTRFHTQTLAYLFEDLVYRGAPIRRFKAVQTEPAHLVLKIVTDVNDTAGRAAISERVLTETSALTGNRFAVDVEFVALEDVVPSTGKYRHFESLVDPIGP